jgi:replication factor C subunit 3/5
VVIQDLIKQMAQTKQIDSHAKQSFKVVVFNEADSLTRGAQAALRRTMEKYMSNLRVILCCNVTSKIISPIRSRCLMIRVPAPSESEVMWILCFTFR